MTIREALDELRAAAREVSRGGRGDRLHQAADVLEIALQEQLAEEDDWLDEYADENAQADADDLPL